MPSSLAPNALRPGDHACSWYSSDEDHEQVAGPFVADGLAGQERVLYLYADSGRTDVLNMVTREGMDADEALADGSLEIRAAGDLYMPGGHFNPDEMLDRLEDEAAGARRDGYRGLRIAAEMSWAIEGAGGSDLGDYEHRANSVFDRSPLTAICLYDRRRFAAGTPSPGGAHGLHVWPDRPSFHYALSVTVIETTDPYGVRLEGEVDFATSVMLADALTRIVDGADGDVHVDLSGLRFIDVGAARLLARAARQLGPARSLVLGSPSRTVRRLLNVLDGRMAAGFVLNEEERGR